MKGFRCCRLSAGGRPQLLSTAHSFSAYRFHNVAICFLRLAKEGKPPGKADVTVLRNTNAILRSLVPVPPSVWPAASHRGAHTQEERMPQDISLASWGHLRLLHLHTTLHLLEEHSLVLQVFVEPFLVAHTASVFILLRTISQQDEEPTQDLFIPTQTFS